MIDVALVVYCILCRNNHFWSHLNAKTNNGTGMSICSFTPINKLHGSQLHWSCADLVFGDICIIKSFSYSYVSSHWLSNYICFVMMFPLTGLVHFLTYDLDAAQQFSQQCWHSKLDVSTYIQASRLNYYFSCPSCAVGFYLVEYHHQCRWQWLQRARYLAAAVSMRRQWRQYCSASATETATVSSSPCLQQLFSDVGGLCSSLAHVCVCV